MSTINEIAPDVYCISQFMPEINLQFNHFLVKDDEPLLYHTGMRRMFPEVKEAVGRIINPSKIRWIGFSHFEVDECGALNQWLKVSPHAQPVHGVVGALVNLNDFAEREPRVMTPEDVLETGKYRFRFKPTPHLPHGWDAVMMFEETNRTLFCSDLFHQEGNLEAVTTTSVLDRVRQAIIQYQAGPLMDYMPFSTKTESLLNNLAKLEPKTLAIMHGSSFEGNGSDALRGLAPIMKEVLGEEMKSGSPCI